MHYWDQGPDARALAVLKSAVQAKGHTWKDFTVAGSNSLSFSMLRARVYAENAPSAAQIKTPQLRMWAREGMLVDLDSVARAQNWDALLPAAIQNTVKIDGKYMAVPTNLHRVNWLWVNSRVLKLSNATIPGTWEEFFTVAESMKRAGFVALAHGGEAWENVMLFANVALGQGGAEFYRQALIELDPKALSGPVMEKVLRTFKDIKPYTGHQQRRRDWAVAAASFVRGTAGMEIMGDWVKPTFVAAQRDGLEFECVPVPGTARAYAFTLDAFVLFRPNNAPERQAQRDFATVIMSAELQRDFNREKGGIPIRQGVDMSRFDRCAKLSQVQFNSTEQNNTLLPDLSLSLPDKTNQSLLRIIDEYWNDDKMPPGVVLTRLAGLAKAR